MSGFDFYNAQSDNLFVQTRTIFLYGEINAALAYDIGFRLKYLEYADADRPITMEINSFGGEVPSSLAIIDTMNYIQCPIKTVVCGMAASMGALIAASGTPGMRFALPNSSIMIHQPLGGMGISQASDVEIFAKNIQYTKKRLNQLLASACNKPVEEIERDTDRDYYLSATEAMEYGLIDGIIQPKKGICV